jgi:hypothetical protein
VKNTVQPGQVTVDNILRFVRFAFWITTATNTHLECVIFFSFPLQKCLRERDSLLRSRKMLILNSNKNRRSKQNLIRYSLFRISELADKQKMKKEILNDNLKNSIIYTHARIFKQ